MIWNFNHTTEMTWYRYLYNFSHVTLDLVETFQNHTDRSIGSDYWRIYIYKVQQDFLFGLFVATFGSVGVVQRESSPRDVHLAVQRFMWWTDYVEMIQRLPVPFTWLDVYMLNQKKTAVEKPQAQTKTKVMLTTVQCLSSPGRQLYTLTVVQSVAYCSRSVMDDKGGRVEKQEPRTGNKNRNQEQKTTHCGCTLRLYIVTI